MNLEALPNPYAKPPSCKVCSDLRMVQVRDFTAQRCPVCGCTCQKRVNGETPSAPCQGCIMSADLKHDANRRYYNPTTLCELDLTVGELATLRMMRAAHPNTPKPVVLSWIEGQRYDPSKDEDFVAEVKRELARRNVTAAGQNGAIVGPTATAAPQGPATPHPPESAPPPLPGAVVAAEPILYARNGIVGGADDFQVDEL
jgi:hypothetical protein